jgi:hypothetical protein
MSSGYSRVVEFEFPCGTPVAVELPMPPRGILERVILTQLDDHPEAATCNIYDRRGACVAANDINVRNSGSVSDISDNSGYIVVTTSAAHELIVGDEIEIKGCTELSYNTLQTVTEVLSETEFVTDVAFVSSETGSGLLWQTKPFDPTTAPVTHLMYTFSKVSGTDYTDFDINQAYENKDNRSPTMRARNSAMWLEVLTVGTAELLKFQVAYTCRADGVV